MVSWETGIGESFLKSGGNSIAKGYGCKPKIWWGRGEEGLYFVEGKTTRCSGNGLEIEPRGQRSDSSCRRAPRKESSLLDKVGGVIRCLIKPALPTPNARRRRLLSRRRIVDCRGS